MENYWQNLHKNKKLSGLQVVCCPDLPPLCNHLLNVQHKAAFNKLLDICIKTGNHLKALDVGCGFGRWCAEYEKRGIAAFGIDIGGSCFIKASATDIPFRDKIFDIVSTVTVLQHIDSKSQEMALNEIERVTVKGGVLLLMEHVSAVSGKEWEGVFPKTESEWISAIEEKQYKIIEKIYFQHTPFMTFAIRQFNAIERVRKSFSKNGAIKQSAVTEQIKSNENRSLSLRLKIYRIIKSFTLSVAAASDYLIVGSGRFGKGSHIAILAVKGNG